MPTNRRQVEPHPVRKLVGDNIKLKMEEKSITALEIGKATGMSRRTVNRAVNGEVAITLDTLGAIADRLNVDAIELFVRRIKPALSGKERIVEIAPEKRVRKSKRHKT